MEGESSINPDIPLTAYEIVGGTGGKEPMGKWALDILYFRKHGKMFPRSESGPRIQLKGQNDIT